MREGRLTTSGGAGVPQRAERGRALPSSQPLITWARSVARQCDEACLLQMWKAPQAGATLASPLPILNLNSLPRPREESNSWPVVSVPALKGKGDRCSFSRASATQVRKK